MLGASSSRKPLFVRSAILVGYESLARGCGLDPPGMLRQVGLTLSDARQPERQLRAAKVFRLLELSAKEAGRPDFGLMLPERRRLSYLGDLGLRMREQPTVRSALQDMAAHLNFHSTCVDLSLEEAPGWAEFRMVVDPDGEPEIRQGAEAALAGMLHLLRLFLGSTWRPLHAQFIHPRPKDITTHSWLFECPLTFSAPWNAVGLRIADLDREIPLADAGFNGLTGVVHQARMSAALDAARVRQAILAALPTGHCSAENVAASSGVHRRTLHRILQREGLTYDSLLQQVRRQLGRQYLLGQMPVADIAAWLGFGDATAFSRWCRRHLGGSPRALRSSRTEASV